MGPHRHLGAMAQRRPPPPEQGTTPPPKVEKQFPVGFSWTAASLNGKPIPASVRPCASTTCSAAPAFPAAIPFSATTYPLREMGFAVGPVAVTRRACDGGAMAWSALPRGAAHRAEVGSRLGPARAQRPERHDPFRARDLIGRAARRRSCPFRSGPPADGGARLGWRLVLAGCPRSRRARAP